MRPWPAVPTTPLGVLRESPTRSATTKASRSPFLLRTLALSVALFALLGLGARNASAQVQTEIFITNNTGVPLTLVGSPVTVLAGGTGWYGTANSLCANGAHWSFGPPQIIPAYGSACFGAEDTTVLAGTGGTIAYNLGQPAGAPLPTAGVTQSSYSVLFSWASPWGVGTAMASPACDGWLDSATTTSAGQTDYGSGPQQGVYALAALSGGSSTCYTNDTTVTWQLNEPPPTSNSSAAFSGYAGSAILIEGTNFDTTGYTQVTFGSVPATSVSCASSTQCTAIAPGGSGVVPVTLSARGESVVVGHFTYLPPSMCSYVTSTSPTGEIWTECVPDAAQDPIYIFQMSTTGAWVDLFYYAEPSYVLGGQEILSGLAVGATETLLGCVWSPVSFPSQAAWMSAVRPGAYGCDSAPTSITIPTPPPPPPPPPPYPSSLQVSAFPFWSGTLSAATLSLNEAAGSTTVVSLSVSDPLGEGRATGVTVPASTTVGAGSATSASFSITASVAALPSVELTMTANGISSSIVIQIATGPFVMSASTSAITLYFHSAPASGAVVSFTDSDATVVAAPASATVSTSTTATVPLTAPNACSADSAVGCGTTTITGTYEGSSYSATVSRAPPPKVFTPPPPPKCGALPC